MSGTVVAGASNRTRRRRRLVAYLRVYDAESLGFRRRVGLGLRAQVSDQSG